MVESGKEYVLQWTGHAAHVTERFSGLLARQALVDVTLICQGQKLRVHKLVLASCSLYFEEMLEQDLGQEPIILLRDLDFDVLKAMVEFMYCGETTISHCHLQTLFDAAQVFKVKELECIVNSMLRSEKSIERSSQESEDSEGVISSSSDRKRACSKMRPRGERCHDAPIASNLEEDGSSECKNDQTLNNNGSRSYGDDDVEHSLYESTDLTSEMAADCPEVDERESSDTRSNSTVDSETSNTFTDRNNEQKTSADCELASPQGEKDFKSIFVGRCRNFTDESRAPNDNATSVNETNSLHSQFEHQDTWNVVGECSRVYTHKKRKYAARDDYIAENLSDSPVESSSADDNFLEDASECPNETKRHEKCLKVYTHKRRKSLDERKNYFVNNVTDSVKEASSTSCIDLSDEASRNNPPVTLAAELDMETSEYIWNLSSESIQYVVGCTINQSGGLVSGGKEGTRDDGSKGVDFERTNNAPGNNKRVGHIKESFGVDNGSLDVVTPPVLRRSVRINQLENDDSINNNGNAVGALVASKGRDKNTDTRNDDCSANSGTIGRARRKVSRETDCRISDENNVTTTTMQQQALRKNTNNSRSLRSTSKLASEKTSGNGARYTPARGDKEERKSKMNGKVRKIDNADCDVFVPTRLNTIASVDRALWGDMSDVLENREHGATLVADYSPSKDIPFAVGLLPLRAALERMQATLDHQPRKTRSSVAPLRQDLNGLKRKDAETIVAMKKHNGSEGDVLAAANTVCHIEIRTSSQCTQNRRTSPSEHMVAVGSTSETNRR